MMRAYQEVTESDRIYPLGMTVMGNRIHAAVAAEGKVCRLLLFGKDQQQPELAIAMPEEKKIGDVWNLTLEGLDLTGLTYCFEVDGKPMADPYGRCFQGWEHWGEAENVNRVPRCPIVQEDFDWEGDQPLERAYHETILYRFHTRGLTKHTSSKVPDKGTFAAIEAKIPYMRELGVTAVELMPMTEFQEVMIRECADGNPYGGTELTGKLNYWGYTKSFAFAPKSSYSSGKEKHPVSEFKHLVKECHKAGLEVVIELYFNGKEPESYALDAVRFWVQEYHVDGIHLVGFPPLELIGNDPYLSRTKLFAQSWSGTSGSGRKHLAEYHAAFQNDMRRLLKGDEDQMRNLAFHIRQNPKEHGVIHYMANTNGFTMMDMVSYDRKHNEANGEGNQDGEDYNYSWNCGMEGPTKKKKLVELRKKQMKNAMTMLFLSQGTPLLLAGDEFGNSKLGNNNTYCQDNELSWINWNLKKTNQDLYEFIRDLIAFRKAHPVFHMEEEPRVMDYLACGHPDISYHGEHAWCPEFEPFCRQMGVMYCGTYAKKADGSPDDYFYVAFNMHWEPHTFALPNLPKQMKWHLAIHTGDSEHHGIWKPGEELLLEEQKQYEVPPRSIVVLIGKEVIAMEVSYQSTRGREQNVSASKAILQGLAADGGLFMPTSIPTLEVPVKTLAKMSYQETAYEVMKLFLTDFTEEELKSCIARAYDEKFDTPVIAPLVKADGAYYLELFHGSTIAFKDMALSILPHLMTTAARKNQVDKEIVILTATSGDTGKAAMAGFADVEGTQIIVFYPKNGVSCVQELQMRTQKGGNTSVVAIYGNFDDAQSGVKRMFADREFAERLAAQRFQLSSANSINIGRLVPQIVYYVYAYAKLVEQKEITNGEAVNVAVPTGNFGNILAAYFAKQMGIPIKTLICASNDNKVLYDFFRTGVYDRNRDFLLTSSPSMDILISSNLERLIYLSAGCDAKKTGQLMEDLKTTGRYEITKEMKDFMTDFYGNFASQEENQVVIQKVYKDTGYVLDPHTGVAAAVYGKYRDETKDKTKTMIASTASPYKFARSVMEAIDGSCKEQDEFAVIDALHRASGVAIPRAVEEIRQAPICHDLECDVADMSQIVAEILKIQ